MCHVRHSSRQRRAMREVLELDQDPRGEYGLTGAKIGVPHAPIVAARSARQTRSRRSAVVAHVLGRRTVVAEGRGDAALPREVGNVRMAESGFGPPGNPLLGHVLEIERGVPLKGGLSGILSEVRCTG